MNAFLAMMLAMMLAVAAAATESPFIFMERQQGGHSWSRVHGSNPDMMHKLVFAVKQSNLDLAANLLQQISDPTSKSYGKHMSFEDVGKLVRNENGTTAVGTWLDASKVKWRKTKHGEYVEAAAPIGVWQRLLRTTFNAYVDGEDSEVVVNRALDYHLPSEIADAVSHVFYTTHLPVGRRPLLPVDNNAEDGSDGKMTPAVLNEVYNIASNEATEGSYSIYESLGQNYSPDDLTTFQDQYSIPLNDVDIDIGGNANSSECRTNPNNCGEANLDVQYLMAVAQGPQVWYWSMDPNSDFADWITAVAGTADAPLVHSVSYGGFEQQTPAGNKNSFETEALKLGLRGVTVVVSSGDDGVAGFVAREGQSNCGYNPSWPASSLYVVSVGATQGPEAGTAEVACDSTTGAMITTGGGFSDAFPAPYFQTALIADYLKNWSNSFGPGYNTTGRGYPDVAMAGHAYQVVIGGKTFGVDGTSASAPVFAGVLSLVNDARIKVGKSPVGYATPTLYALAKQDPTIFNDITTGKNNCAAKGKPTTVCCTKQGFRAAAGWDPLTGLGSVNVAKLIAAWTALA